MSEPQKLGLLANLGRVKAQDTIHNGRFDHGDYQGVYELYLQAYGDEKLARRAQSQAAEIYVERKMRA